MNETKRFRLTSWHILILSLGLSVGALVTLWIEVLQPRQVSRADAVSAATRRLNDLKLLSEDDVGALDRQTRELKQKASSLRAELESSGIAALPVGQPSVIGVQQAVSQALMQRKLKVVEASVSARVERAPSKAVPAPVAKPLREMTAEEYEAESMKAAAALDPKMRGDYVKRVRAQVAKMRAAEAKRGDVTKAVEASPRRTAVTAPVVQPFKTENLVCRAQGRFRDVFLFFVDESYKKPSYNLADISVRRSSGTDGLMDLVFTLQANYR